MKKYSLGLYEKAMPGTLNWKEKLETAKEAGYDFVEISIDATEEKIARLDMTKEERFEIIKAMYEVGIPIRTMCVSALTKYSLGNNKEEYCKRGMEILEKSLQLADDLGIRVVMIPGYDVYYEPSTLETKKRFLKNLKKPIRYAKYGYHGSQLSKATLLLAADKLVKENPGVVSYFPAYEIMNDELRDYRFYKEDPPG